jgi:hypothetical protein
MLSTPISQIITIDTRDDDILETHGSDRLCQVERFIRIGWTRFPVGHIAEGASAGAEITQDHECGCSLSEAFPDIGTGGLLAHGVEFLLSQDTLDLVELLAVRGSNTYPRRFT